LNAVDTSVAVPAVAGWHESHELCRRAAAGSWISSHVRIEAYSVLTRIPSPHRLAADTAARVLVGFFRNERILYPSADLMNEIVGICGAAGIAGGAIYDAFIASIALDHNVTLLTLDRRAIRTYELLGVDSELLVT